MKIINRYIFNVTKQNGPDSYEKLIEVIETESGKFYEVLDRQLFREFNREHALRLIAKSTTNSDS